MTNTDQPGHRCDPAIDVNIADTPLTQLRVLRVLLAVLAGNVAEANRTMEAFGSCPRCLRQGLSISIGNTIAALAENGEAAGDQLMDLEMRIAGLEARLGDDGGAW